MKIKTHLWIYSLVITGVFLMLASSCKKKEEIIIVVQPVSNWIELGGTNNGLNANDQINSICTDAAGNVYAAGAFTNASGCYVAKYPFDKH